MSDSSIVSQIKHPLVAGFSSCLVVIFAARLLMGDSGESMLALSPANTLIAKKYVWNLVTCSFFEANLVKLLCDLMVLALTVKPSVDLGSNGHFLIYIAVVVLGCGVFTFLYCMIRFFATGLEEMLIEPMYGFSGTFIAIAMFYRVHLKNEIVIPGFPVVTYHNLPVIVLVGQFMCYAISPLKFMAHDLPFTVVAIPLTWSYLKFFYKHEDAFGNSLSGANEPGAVVGEEFNFVNMFPEPLHVVVSPFTTAFYNLFALLGIFPEILVVENPRHKAHHLFNHFNSSQTPFSTSQPSSPAAPAVKNAIEDRRRAKALKLLDAKMAELEAAEDELAWNEGE